MTTKRLVDVDITDRDDGKVPVWRDASNTHEYEAAPSPPAADPPTIQVIAASGTYTKPAGLHHARVQICGGGGGSGGTAATGAGQGAMSANGGGGEYAEAWLDESEIAATETVTIGAAGSAGSAGNNAGGTGGTTSFGALLTAVGGSGGAGSGTTAGPAGGAGGAGGTGGGGTAAEQWRSDGGMGDNSWIVPTGQPIHIGGPGYPPVLGRKNRLTGSSTSAGGTGVGYGGGGTSAFAVASQSAQAGGAGSPGVCIVTEFYS